MELKQLKRQMVILDVLPFVYNFVFLLNSIFDYFRIYSSITCIIFGYSLFVVIDLYLRSIDNKYCAWHRIPIYNMAMATFFYIIEDIVRIYFNYNLISDPEYPILYILFLIWTITFIVSVIFFFKKRIKKLHKRCT